MGRAHNDGIWRQRSGSGGEGMEKRTLEMKGLCVCVNNNNDDDVNYCSLIKPKVNIGKKTITNSILLWVPRLGHKSFFNVHLQP